MAEIARQDFTSTYLVLGPRVPGMLYQPVTPNERTGTAVLSMHPLSNDLGHISSSISPLAATPCCAPIHTLWARTTVRNLIEDQAPDVALAVKYLRGRPDIRSIVLLGRSASGPLRSFYQTVAENGRVTEMSNQQTGTTDRDKAKERGRDESIEDCPKCPAQRQRKSYGRWQGMRER